MHKPTDFNGLTRVISALLISITSFSDALKPPSYLPHPNPTKSFWLYPPSTNPLGEVGSTGELTSSAHVCIIGSGITGVGAAWHLANQLGSQNVETKKKIAVLDAREFCSGATGRNGGHLTPTLFYAFRDRERAYGTDEARRSYRIEQHTANSLLDFIRANNLESEVDLFEGGHLSVFRTAEEAAGAKADWEAARKADVDMGDVDGHGGVRWLGTEELVEIYGFNPELNYTAAWFSGHNLWPCKVVTKLFEDAQKQDNLDIALHTKTPVTSISKLDDARWNLHTPRGEVACNYVVHATNAYAGHLLPFLRGQTPDIDYIGSQVPLSLRPRAAFGIVPTRGQVGAVQASVDSQTLKWKNSWDGGAGWEYWFPRYQDVESHAGHRPLIILGGGRQHSGEHLEQGITDDSVLNERVDKALKSLLPRLFPHQFKHEDAEQAWEMQWTGIMGFTNTGEPFVGPVQPLAYSSNLSVKNPYEGQYIAAGFTGHGMTRAFACVEAVAGMIVAKIRGEEWATPEWLPSRYLTWATEP
ncbi:unnamed protein product [Cyclocybe aegerita]|uniref:FAD dependent oxidoreductase domain-containing protein n=1 Tax=Cyclocybe aegerita TaxID=1973307 RepID=A0A8S0WS16_CYCAE|nr:unnamed protein product [Cyclocybe aegerita]